MQLKASELNTIFECLRAAAYGPFFPDWEFHTLFGLEREEVMEVAEKWPIVSLTDETVCCAVNNSMNHMLFYPIRSKEDWDEYMTIDRAEIHRVFDKWRGEISKGSLGDYFDRLM